MSLIPLVVADLRQITTAAIANAQRELAAKKRQLLATAMEQLKIEVIAGRQHSVAMSLRSGDDYASDAGKGQVLRPDQLIGVAALLFGEFQTFAPTIEYWSKVESDYRETYTVSGFNIVLHWTDVNDLLAKLALVNQNDTARLIRDGIIAAQAEITRGASAILSQLGDRTSAQARDGKNWAIVMSLKAGTDFECPSGMTIRQIQAGWLGPWPGLSGTPAIALRPPSNTGARRKATTAARAGLRRA